MSFFIAYRPADSTAQYFESTEESDSFFHFADFEKRFHHRLAVKQTNQFPSQLHFKGIQSRFVGEEDYQEMVSNAIQEMQDGRIAKIVLSRSLTYEHQIHDWEGLFHAFCKAYPKAHVVLFSHPDQGCWLGASPEILLQQQGNTFKTMALAGTKWDETQAWGVKEIEEQAYVTQFIKKELEGLKVEWKKDGSEVQTVKAGDLYHLRSDFEFESYLSAAEILQVLHPTPAVAGIPTNMAMNFIKDQEGRSRRLYAGYWGLEKGQNASFFVNLRCMRFNESMAEIFVGGGLTKDSIPCKEWEETERKSGTILKILKQYENI